MNSNRPYLVRALYDWICDNHMTPHLLVDASDHHLNVPANFIEDGRVVFNISSGAVRDLDVGQDEIRFKARFSGSSICIHFQIESVLAIYAKENGRGMFFSNEDAGNKTQASPKKRPVHLQLVTNK